jgi:hypothetical protein
LAPSAGCTEPRTDRFTPLLPRCFRDLGKKAGARTPGRLAQQFMLLSERAGMSAWMDHDPSGASSPLGRNGAGPRRYAAIHTTSLLPLGVRPGVTTVPTDLVHTPGARGPLTRLHDTSEQQVQRAQADTPTAGGIRLLHGTFHHREQNAQVVHAQIRSDDPGGLRFTQRLVEQFPRPFCQAANATPCRGSATQQPQQARRACLLQDELPHDVDESARIACALLREFGHTIEALVENGDGEQRAFGEMTIQRRLTNACALSDAVERHIRSLPGQQFCERLDDGRAIALGVGAAYAAWLLQLA